MAHKEQRDALDTRPARARADNEIIRIHACGDEGFRAVEDVVIAIFFRGRF